MFRWLAQALGFNEGPMYHFYSGVGPFLLGCSFFATWLRKHLCERRSCFRWRPHPVDGRVLCRHHK
jgi:hypothetical protein